jgi:alpha/beta superfamily hydrolase|tara:strand:- start:178 stop:834 length:657 start_codon:yes stop_codon:yes gene_type:complete
MQNESKEIFIAGPSGRLQAIYYKNKKQGSPVAIVLQPHPQYGGTMNNRIVFETYNCFYKNGFSIIRINFRGVEKSDGIFDNGQGELSDAAAALDWIEKENPGFSQCWVSGFSFGSLICMQLIMRRPEVNRFIAISPQPNVYDFTFLAPCPAPGLIAYGQNDELVPEQSILDFKKKLNRQKNIEVNFEAISNANHFYKKKEKELSSTINKYIEQNIPIY